MAEVPKSNFPKFSIKQQMLTTLIYLADCILPEHFTELLG